MKLFRFGETGKEKIGLIDGEVYRDISSFGEGDFDSKFFETGGLERLKNWAAQNLSNCPAIPNGVRLGSPITGASKIVCIGLNYKRHAKETGAEIPQEPVIFFKATSAIVGPNDNLTIPKNSQKTDWEVELAAVIGKKASHIKEADAEEYIAGYCLHNDYSERAFQIERGGQWVKGKSCDTFAPLGPFLATRESLTDPQNLNLWLKVNGEIRQNSNTKDMIFTIRECVSYVSQFMSLLPGDVISTGTPEGVGLGMNPPQYLKPGDVVELGIEELGSSRQVAKAFA